MKAKIKLFFKKLFRKPPTPIVAAFISPEHFSKNESVLFFEPVNARESFDSADSIDIFIKDINKR